MRSYRATKYRSQSAQQSSWSRQKRQPPRQDSPNANDPRNRTSYHPEQADWSWSNLPEILYQLNPNSQEDRHKEPRSMPYPIHGRYLRHLPILPDNISSTVEEFRVEAWQRMDARIFLDDITARMHPDFRIKNNALQQRGVRFRQSFNLKAWRSGNKRSTELEIALLQKMDEAGLDINSNSTRGITPGLIDPKAGEAGGRVPLPKGWCERKKASCSIKVDDRPFLPVIVESDSVAKRPETLPAPPTESTTPIPVAVPATPERNVEVIEHTHEFVKFDEQQSQPNGALPTLRGSIPDDQLPDTVSMYEIDLHQGYTHPTPQLKVESEDQPLMYNQDRLEYRGNHYTSSSVLSLYAFCNLPCFRNFPPQPEEYLDYVTPSYDARNKPQTPTAGIFPITIPVQLNMIPEEQHRNIFDDALADFYGDRRQLCEMPYDPALTA
ncbi:hypothetical protein BDW69DRAFT_190418 [Aspergillus filifer]